MADRTRSFQFRFKLFFANAHRWQTDGCSTMLALNLIVPHKVACQLWFNMRALVVLKTDRRWSPAEAAMPDKARRQNDARPIRDNF